MRAALLRRLARLTVARRAVPSYCVWIDHTHWDQGQEHLDAETAVAIEENRIRTGWEGAVMVAPIPCRDEAEWIARYCGHLAQ